MRRAITAAAVLLLTAGSAGAAPFTPAVGPTNQRPTLTALTADFPASFSAFRLPHGAQDVLPPAVAQGLASGPPAWFGVNGALAKKVGPTFIVPGNHSLCLVTPFAGLGATVQCADLTVAATVGIIGATNGGVVGLVPDGVRSARIASKTKATTASVHLNVFAAKIPHATKVSFRLRGREHVLHFPA